MNSLLDDYGMRIADGSITGGLKFKNKEIYFSSGAYIQKFPAGGFLFGEYFKDDESSVSSAARKDLYRAVFGLKDRVTIFILDF